MLIRWQQVEGAGIHLYPEGFVAAGVRCGLKERVAKIWPLLVSESASTVAGKSLRPTGSRPPASSITRGAW